MCSTNGFLKSTTDVYKNTVFLRSHSGFHTGTRKLQGSDLPHAFQGASVLRRFGWGFPARHEMGLPPFQETSSDFVWIWRDKWDQKYMAFLHSFTIEEWTWIYVWQCRISDRTTLCINNHDGHRSFKCVCASPQSWPFRKSQRSSSWHSTFLSIFHILRYFADTLHS